MPDQQPGEAEFAEAWPALRERWLSEGLSTEQLVQAAYLAGFAARKAQLMRLAYSPEGIDELRAERFRAADSVRYDDRRQPLRHYNPASMPPPADDRWYGSPGFLPAPEPYTGQPTREDTRLMAAVEGEEPADPGHEDGKGGGNGS